ncbi:MAG: hypothetical protein K6L73_06855 [Cellvibrionaceae bacterium]
MIFPFLKYKQQLEPCVAKGPSISSAIQYKGDYQGSSIVLALPKSNHKNPSPDIQFSGSYGQGSQSASHSDRRWREEGYMTRGYRFWGPRGVGEVHELSAEGWFASMREPKEEMSLFHPRAFEWAVIDYVEDRLVNKPKERWATSSPNTIRAPIFWQPFDHLPGPAAFFHIDTGSTTTPNYYFVTVLDDNDLLFVGFDLDVNRFGPKHIPPEEWVDMRNMKQLMFDIFNTLEIELSPEAEARRKKAIEGLDDTSLRSTMETQVLHFPPKSEQASIVSAS